jgi:hypothetical protein
MSQLLTISFEGLPSSAWTGVFGELLAERPGSDIEVVPDQEDNQGLGAGKKSELAVWIGAGSTSILAVLGIVQTISAQIHPASAAANQTQIDIYGDHNDVRLVAGLDAKITKEQVEQAMKKTGSVRSIHCHHARGHR